ncbi:MAG: hypothetical protein JW724_03655, partial [Candidatus Altiarchaeota archaeon]|nr:hypothetical protein [Candidatus Altiarchaeota archaeon]
MKIPKNFRGQSGVDLLMSYGWIVVVGVGAVVILSQMGLFSDTLVPCSKNQMGFAQVVPADWAVYRGSNMLVLTVENDAGDPVEITGVSAVLGDVECSLETSAVMEAGGRGVYVVGCSVDPSVSGFFNLGSCYTADVAVAYRNVVTGNAYESRGRLSGSVEEGLVTTTTSTTTTTTSTTTTTTTSTTTTTTTSTTTTTT